MSDEDTRQEIEELRARLDALTSDRKEGRIAEHGTERQVESESVIGDEVNVQGDDAKPLQTPTDEDLNISETGSTKDSGSYVLQPKRLV